MLRLPAGPAMRGLPVRPGVRLDRLGLLLALLVLAGIGLLPFVIVKANRIASGVPQGLFAALPGGLAPGLAGLLALVALAGVLLAAPAWRGLAAVGGIAALVLAVGFAATGLIEPGDRYARVSPGSGFWLLLFALAMLATDALARLRLGPAGRVLCLAAALAALGALLASGAWDQLSLLREYGVRSAIFWREARTHLLLSFGALASAALAGIPLGLLCHRLRRIAVPLLQLLNIIQTVPSIALFGLLMAPLGYLAAHLPGAAALGIRGIGAAPAMIAIFGYSLLPIVANTVIGLAQVPADSVDAARGMGMTAGQSLRRVELPLALPAILTGVRIVLVQGIGLVTVAGLIGGGGFGSFVFQGLGQTAMDLVLLGALPTVGLAFAAAVLLDAAIEAARRGRT